MVLVMVSKSDPAVIGSHRRLNIFYDGEASEDNFREGNGKQRLGRISEAPMRSPLLGSF